MSNDEITDDAPLEAHKQHFACFACRKAFKPRGTESLGVETERVFPCPECAAPMTLMGRDFQAPPLRAVKEWHVLEMLRGFGVIFEPGTPQPSSQPHTLAEAENYLIREGYDEVVIRERLMKIRELRREGGERPTRKEKKQRERRPRR